MMAPSAQPALFILDGKTAHPGQLACGPWSPDTLHGGAVAALAGALAEARAGTAGGRLARLTVDLLAPVPRAPLRIEMATLRAGRRVVRRDVSLRAAGELVARATALHVQPAALELPAAAVAGAPPAGPEGGLAHREACAWTAFNTDAIELRHAPDDALGAAAWVRLRAPVLHGHEPTPATRAAAVADLAGGIAAALPGDRYDCVNADLALHLHRRPAGEWIALRAATELSTAGHAIAHALLYDAAGPIGRAAQTVVVTARC